jgi:hypothetical protein
MGGEQQVLDREVVVAQVFAHPGGLVEQGGQFAVHARLVATVRARQAIDSFLGAVAHLARGLTQFGEQGRDDGAVLVAERDEQVVDGEIRVGERLGLVNGCGDSLLGLGGPCLWIKCHDTTLQRQRGETHQS